MICSPLPTGAWPNVPQATSCGLVRATCVSTGFRPFEKALGRDPTARPIPTKHCCSCFSCVYNTAIHSCIHSLTSAAHPPYHQPRGKWCPTSCKSEPHPVTHLFLAGRRGRESPRRQGPSLCVRYAAVPSVGLLESKTASQETTRITHEPI